jgi:small subunit ribosomal protein S9
MVTKKETKKKAAPKAKKKPLKKTEAEVPKEITPEKEVEKTGPKVEEKAETKAEEKPAPKPKKATKKTIKKKAKEKVVIARGKRKEAVARATVKSGKGTIRFNRKSIDSIDNIYVREIIREPMRYLGSEANTVAIKVNVFGGGAMGQAQAARTAIAKALSEYFADLNVKDKFASIDRSLIVEDTRRVEPKKYKGPKARARYQKSYR